MADNNDLTREQRIAKEQNNIMDSLNSSNNAKNITYSHKGINIEFSNMDSHKPPDKSEATTNDLSKRMNTIQEKAEALAPEIKQQIQNHDRVVESLQKDRIDNYKLGNEIKTITYGQDKDELDAKFTNKYIKDQNENYRYAFNNDLVAFQNRGDHIVVNGKPATVSEDVVKLLKSEGVKEISVSGETEHKKLIWKYATDRGIDVKGYTPTKEDIKEMQALTNKVSIINKGNEVLSSHQKAAIQIAENNLHPDNKAQFVRETQNRIKQKQNNNEHVPKVEIKQSEKHQQK